MTRDTPLALAGAARSRVRPGYGTAPDRAMALQASAVIGLRLPFQRLMRTVTGHAGDAPVPFAPAPAALQPERL